MDGAFAIHWISLKSVFFFHLSTRLLLRWLHGWIVYFVLRLSIQSIHVHHALALLVFARLLLKETLRIYIRNIF